jgi:WS/DGAT C-terminal domain
MTSTKPTVLD